MWIVGLGGLVPIELVTYNVLGEFGLIPRPSWYDPTTATVIGLMVFLASMSIYLSLTYAQLNANLEAKLVEVHELSERTLEQERRAREQELARQLLEADNARKTRELEEARELQLSMLPSSVPSFPGIEIAVYMKTASEVGGDYYDFHANGDDALTIAIGDATGHGARAGTMVAATKGLFNVLGSEPDLVGILRQTSLALKNMRMGRMYMALQLARVRDRRVAITSAGMPPALVYRAATDEVEEVKIPGMPLGSVPSFPYRREEIELGPGDVVAFMSDGLPEMFNPDREMLDYARVREIFRAAATGAPAEIIERLVAAGEEWAGSRPQDDDVTFVVLKAG